jgi:acyl-CoA thioester hydrolase
MSEGKVLIEAPVTVRWGDMDAFAHVNNAAYATYVEEARLRWFETIEGVWRDDEISPILAAQHINYRIPIEWPAEVVVQLGVGRVGNTSFTVTFRIVDRADPSRLYADGDNVLVWIARSSGKSIVLPECVRAVLS